MSTYDDEAAFFDGWRGLPGDDEVAGLLDLLHGRRSVLDVGGGTGRYALPLAQAGHVLTLADRSRGMLQQAHRKGLDRLVRADAADLPFGDRRFDAVLFVETLHLWKDWAGGVREMGRVTDGPVVAVIKERVPDPRKIYLETRTEMGHPTGLLDEGVRAFYRMLPPETVREVRVTRREVDFEEVIGGIEKQGHPEPGVHEEAIRRVRGRFGSTRVEQVETVKLARWSSGALRAFRPPRSGA
jgi:SAM-dependent methyltransferase